MQTNIILPPDHAERKRRYDWEECQQAIAYLKEHEAEIDTYKSRKKIKRCLNACRGAYFYYRTYEPGCEGELWIRSINRRVRSRMYAWDAELYERAQARLRNPPKIRRSRRRKPRKLLTPEQKRKRDLARRRAYYAAHREEDNAKSKAYRVAHRDGLKAKTKAYYAAHRDELNAKGKAYRVAHRDELNAKRKAYRVMHRDELKAKRREYRAKQKALAASAANNQNPSQVNGQG